MKKLIINIKNMVCPSCITVLKNEIEQKGGQVEEIILGKATILLPDHLDHDTIETILSKHGFAVIKDEGELTVEQVKLAVQKLIKRQSLRENEITNSDFIAREVGKSYRTLSDLFSEEEGITIEKYIIEQKIKRTRELLKEGELSLSEIAAALGYSSVQHLSTQFKKVVGVSVSNYKKTTETDHVTG